MAPFTVNHLGEKVKHCPRCNETLPLERFYVSPKGRIRSFCKPCNAAWSRAYTQLHKVELRAKARERPERRDPERRKIWKREYRLKNLEKFKAAKKRSREKHIEKVRAANRKWKQNYPHRKERSRAGAIMAKYGLTMDEWHAIFASQENKCAACGSTEPKSKSGWHTDHCHTTGKVRGILCCHCNIGIGSARDKIATLRQWLAYLERHSEGDQHV